MGGIFETVQRDWAGFSTLLSEIGRDFRPEPGKSAAKEHKIKGKEAGVRNLGTRTVFHDRPTRL